MNRLKTAIGSRPWKVLGATTVLGAVGYQRYNTAKRLAEDEKRKKVLVLPFHKMKIVEEKKTPISSFINKLSNAADDIGVEDVIEMQADELVSLIQQAAKDPSIVGLYGEFGGAFSTGGWAHLEEIRNALDNFAKTSSLNNNDDNELDEPPKRKAMYAYSNTFGGQQSMKEYYLASAFSRIHMQPQGDLNLFGLHASNVFFRGFLKKYGITVYTWKHGAFKNMANMFTHSKYTREHYENTAGILLPIHEQVCKSIYSGRNKQFKRYGYDFNKFWNMIENVGSFPADVAYELGFVDHLPLKNPLESLVKNNKTNGKVVTEKTDEIVSDMNTNSTASTATSVTSNEENTIVPKHKIVNDHDEDDQWKLETDPDNFTADSKISIDAYARQKANAKRKEGEGKFFQSLINASESNDIAKRLLSLLDYENWGNEAKVPREKIAVIKINGAIGEKTARKAEKALRQVKEQKDVKCVVLRVDSPGGSINACESLYQEIQDLPQKVVVSFGNVSASGGYYISSAADQIFASSSTITGSIGVVMMRMDFKELAKRYGITFDSVSTSALSGSNDPFYPINRQMDENFANQADRSYHRFKSLVSTGRKMDMKAVEKISKGRVWTGKQAHEIGLVDKLGGLEEAIVFAKQNYTTSGDAKVVQWPPKRSLWEFLTSRGQQEDGANDFDNLDMPDVLHVVVGGLFGKNNQLTSMSGSAASSSFALPPIPVTSGIMLTVDENTAIQCMLEEANISKDILPFNDVLNARF